jgi:hypothetical protein
MDRAGVGLHITVPWCRPDRVVPVTPADRGLRAVRGADHVATLSSPTAQRTDDMPGLLDRLGVGLDATAGGMAGSVIATMTVAGSWPVHCR